ncbi:hypothetical protein EYF80_040429 [Liparis tanakae]|uniref:Secreted peptide n=1 Tax=Liparis tanakae TaxID=230148 RepID=A0A4Z2G757_9TELE|nr:hypothetical protein EYF80_040429 [Liparis tanakae]
MGLVLGILVLMGLLLALGAWVSVVGGGDGGREAVSSVWVGLTVVTLSLVGGAVDEVTVVVVELMVVDDDFVVDCCWVTAANSRPEI